MAVVRRILRSAARAHARERMRPDQATRDLGGTARSLSASDETGNGPLPNQQLHRVRACLAGKPSLGPNDRRSLRWPLFRGASTRCSAILPRPRLNEWRGSPVLMAGLAQTMHRFWRNQTHSGESDERFDQRTAAGSARSDLRLAGRCHLRTRRSPARSGFQRTAS